MKKVLFATTALVATAGVAAADVSFGGLGRFGVYYQEGATDEWSLESRFRLIVTGTAESDNGLSFGAQIRYQANEHSRATFNTPRFWVTSNGFTVSVGQTLGAIENMPNMYTGTIGLTGLGFANAVYNFAADGYTSGGAGTQGIDVIWSGGAWGVHLSHSWDDQGNSGNGISSDRTALMVSYAFGNWTVAAGYNDGETASCTIAATATDCMAQSNEWVLTSGANFGNWDVSFNIASNKTFKDDGTTQTSSNELKYGVGFNYQATATTFIRGYLNHDEALSDENIGIGFQHRMGGGTFLEGGIADLAGTTRADLGLRFSF